jgi:hypothetical protein
MAALGQVANSEMTTVDDFLRIDRLRRHRLVQDAASGGFLETVRDGLRVAPDSMRFALVAHWFFEQRAAWPIDDVIQAGPTHKEQIAAAVVNAAAMGSGHARARLDEIVPDLTELPRDELERYTALDGAAADRALTQTAALGPDHFLRHAVLSAATRRYAHRDAIRALLDSAIGDERAEHSNPDHPIRLLGEVGSRIDPHGNTSFAARGPILEIATGWFDEEPSPQRGILWAKLIVHLLDPRAEGNYQDLGSPMKIQGLARFVEGRVELRADDALNVDGARVEIVERDGTRHVEVVEVAKGHPRDPISQAELEAKVRRCADGIIGEMATQELIERVMKIEAETGLDAALGLVRPEPAAA